MSLSFTQTNQLLAMANEIAVLLPVLISIFTWRGFVQAAIANLAGDDTPKRYGFLTLNPIAHINLFGMLTVILVFFVLGGIFYNAIPRAVLFIFLIIMGVRWTIPVPFDDRAFKKHRLGNIAMALAGSIGNILLAFVTIPLLKLVHWLQLASYVTATFDEIFKTIINIALFFGVIDLIPLPPFDGGRVLRYILPQSAQGIVDWLEQYALFIFFLIFFMPGVSDFFFTGIMVSVFFIKKAMLLFYSSIL